MGEEGSKRKLGEVEVLFDLFLPMFCETRAAALEKLPISIDFRVPEVPDRSWRVQGGARPFVRKDLQDPSPATLTVTVAQALVRALVQGNDPDLASARTRGELHIDGDLAALGVSPQDLERLLAAGLR